MLGDLANDYLENYAYFVWACCRTGCDDGDNDSSLVIYYGSAMHNGSRRDMVVVCFTLESDWREALQDIQDIMTHGITPVTINM